MTSIEDFRLIIWAITEMVPDLIWASDFFGAREIWSLRYLVPEIFGPPMKIIIWHFHAGPKLLGAQISQGPIKSGPK